MRAQSLSHPLFASHEDARPMSSSLESGLSNSLDPQIATMLDDLFGPPAQL